MKIDGVEGICPRDIQAQLSDLEPGDTFVWSRSASWWILTDQQPDPRFRTAVRLTDGKQREFRASHVVRYRNGLKAVEL